MPESSWSAASSWDSDPGDAAAPFGAVLHDGVYTGDDPDEPDASDAPDGAATGAPDGDDAGFATYSVGQASLRGGEIQLTATDSGLPLALRVSAAQLRREPRDLGDDLVRLCRLAAGRAGLTRRSYLTDIGIPAHAVELLGLPTQTEVERMELADEAVHEYEPRSLMEPDGSIW
ncbi:hypothetical protein ABIA39_001704 [Nocardia sp. GAS34]|uniref:hypothetical protein n=1 Tax=unclassified Nocardia TaxID=2637762 RepID=UPI003D1CB67B